MHLGVDAVMVFGWQRGKTRKLCGCRARRKRAGVTVSVGTGGKRHDSNLKGLRSAPIQGLDIDRGLFVFGPATPFALSWECRRG